MQFDFDFYSSLLLIFFVHTIVYSVLFFVKYKKHKFPSAIWMSLFLLLAALYICPWMLGFAGWYNKQPYRDILFYVPFQHLLLMGPCIFFYIQSLFNPQFSFGKKEALHFVPFFLYISFCVVMVVYDKLIVREYFFLKNQQDPDFETWYQNAGFLSMVVYLIASIKYYYQYKKAIEEVISNAANFLFSWVRNFLIAFLAMQIAWVILAAYGLMYHTNYSNIWWYFFSFAIITYYIAIAGYSNAVETKIFFKSNIFSNQNQVLFLNNKHPLYLENISEDFQEIVIQETDKPTENQTDYTSIKLKIEDLIFTQKMYEMPELTLLDVAQKLGVNISVLSKIVNQAFQVNFNDLVNKYRVAAIVALLQKKEHKKQTLLSIAFECGFNSKSTFNRAFKKEKGCTPQEFIRNMSL